MHSPWHGFGRRLSLGQVGFRGIFLPFAEISNASPPTPEVHGRVSCQRNPVRGRQACRGIYFLCKGRVKLSATSKEGHTLIFKIAQPGEVLGLNAIISGTSHETTAEAGQPCQLNFVHRDDFLKFLTKHGGCPLGRRDTCELRGLTGVPAPSLIRNDLSTRGFQSASNGYGRTHKSEGCPLRGPGSQASHLAAVGQSRHFWSTPGWSRQPTRSAVMTVRIPPTVNSCRCGSPPSKLSSGKYPYVAKNINSSFCAALSGSLCRAP